MFAGRRYKVKAGVMTLWVRVPYLWTWGPKSNPTALMYTSKYGCHGPETSAFKDGDNGTWELPGQPDWTKRPWQPSFNFLLLWHWLLRVPTKWRHTAFVFLCGCFFSLITMPSRFTCIATSNTIILLVFYGKLCLALYVTLGWFVDGHLGPFHILTAVKRAAIFSVLYLL